MMTLRQFYLTKLAEECNEVSQRALKSMQFGPDEIQDGQTKTNRLRLTEEIMDLLTVLLLVENRTDDMFKPSDLLLETHAIAKIEKIEKYLKYSQSLGEVGNE